ncbi:MAG: hypothetical protein PVH93_05895 [Nitrosopumilaceae archaeon]|jgi:hypothetical protein
MDRKKTTVTTGIILSLLILPSVGNIAFAQYPSDQTTGLDSYIEIQKERVKIAEQNPGTGSGTPMFAADGIVGAVLLSAGVFGGVAAVFFVKGRKGKYAALGRG